MENEFHIARITLEACSPVMIAGGGDDPLYDVLLARDVNGLPMLPATSLAGVLRHGFGEDEEKACAFFGLDLPRFSGQFLTSGWKPLRVVVFFVFHRGYHAQC